MVGRRKAFRIDARSLPREAAYRRLEGKEENLVTVKLFTTLRKATGEKSYQSSARSVAEVLKEVEDTYGDKVSRYLKNCNVLVNGRNVGYLRGKRTKLRPGDEVSLFPPLAGG